MEKKLIALVFLALVSLAKSQIIDTSFCDVSNVVSDDGANLPVPFRNESEIYSAVIDRAQLISNGFAVEINEIYDGRLDVGVAIQRTFAGAILSYSFVNTSEFLYIDETGTCQVLPLDQAYTLSPFEVIVDKNNKKHLASPLTLLSRDPDLPRAYLGSRNRVVRGIAVREWIACAYSETQKSTLRITISYSNPQKWTSAFPELPGQESVPVQLRFDHKPANTQIAPFSEIYSILEFKTNNLVDPNFLSIPSGIYCKDRLTVRKLPELPTAFSFVEHVTVPADELYQSGGFTPLRFEYDTEKELARSDSYNPKRQLITDIEDFGTGLSYSINDFEGTCEVSVAGFKKPQDLFLLDQDPKPEYLGFQTVRGISTEAWIAPRTFQGKTSLIEWHFASPSWASFESEGRIQREPVATYVYTTIIVAGQPKTERIEFHVANFDRTKIDLYDFDIAICKVAAQKHLRFTITDKEKYEVMRANGRALREGAFLAVQSSANVRVIRLSLFEVIFDQREVVDVVFTLLDKANLGNNLNEVTLDQAYNSLAKDIKESRLLIKFVDSRNSTISVRADSNSLTEIDARNGRYQFNYVSSGKTLGVSSGIVIMLVVLFLILGLAAGLVGGVFIVIKRSVNIPLPGPLSYFNPNFANQESA